MWFNNKFLKGCQLNFYAQCFKHKFNNWPLEWSQREVSQMHSNHTMNEMQCNWKSRLCDWYTKCGEGIYYAQCVGAPIDASTQQLKDCITILFIGIHKNSHIFIGSHKMQVLLANSMYNISCACVFPFFRLLQCYFCSLHIFTRFLPNPSKWTRMNFIWYAIKMASIEWPRGWWRRRRRMEC